MLERGIAWLTSYQTKQAQLLENGVSEIKPFKTFADDIDALVFMVLTDAGAGTTRCSASWIAIARIFGLCQGGCSAWRSSVWAKREAGRRPPEHEPVRRARRREPDGLPQAAQQRITGGRGMAARSRPMRSISSCSLHRSQGRAAPRLVKYVLNNRRHGSTGTRPATRRFASRPWPILEGQRRGPARDDGRDRDRRPAKKEVKITPADLFSFDNSLVLEGQALATGEHTVSFVKQGRGPLYYQCLPDQLHA